MNTDFWSMSLTMFTCVFTAVTIRIFLWTRWWTCVNFVFYTIFSICVYISYIWIAESMELSADFAFVAQTHKSPLFWLTLFLVGGTIFCIDWAVSYIKYTDYKDASDKVREFVVVKRSQENFSQENGVRVTNEDIKVLEDFIEPIRQKFRDRELEREKELDKDREKKR